MAKKKGLTADNSIPEEFHEYRVSRKGFTIYIGGESAISTPDGAEPGVEHRMADRLEMNLDMLSSINPNKPILVKISSCGGNWEEGMQMFGAILACPNPITVLSVKWARSMTSIIPLAADKFVIRPPAQYMFHRGTFGFNGLDQEAETENAERVKSNEIMYRLYTARLSIQGKFRKLPEKKIRSMLNEITRQKINVWLSASEAKDWGFVDEVYDNNPKTLRTTVRNEARRASMLAVLNSEIKVEVRAK
jgi:ATP-dependent protease ClpP protease subunit